MVDDILKDEAFDSIFGKGIYRDKEGNEINIEQLEKFLRDDSYRIVRQDILQKHFISTVWLGVPHGLFRNECFETMVFSMDEGTTDPRSKLGKSLECERYITMQEAIEGHEKILKEYKELEEGLKQDEKRRI
jgi:hypothetical protein